MKTFLKPPSRVLNRIRFDLMGSPEVEASRDLESYSRRLYSICETLPSTQHGVALTWISDWRMYCFEQNESRWPDGRFYLLTRGYQPWRKHLIGFTREELTAIGCDEWDRRVITTGHDKYWVPMEADCFRSHPRRQLPRYVRLVHALADAFEERRKRPEPPAEIPPTETERQTEPA